MSEPTTAPMSLAQQLADPEPTTTELAAAPRSKSLLLDLASAAGLSVRDFWPAVKTCAGCQDAKDEHFMVLLMQAQKYGLDPLSSPPQLQLLNVGQGPQVYARLDSYKTFLHRAEDANVLSERSYEEGWFLDPRQSPDKKILRRGGRARGTITKNGKQRNAEKIVWFDEWGGKGQWAIRGSHMLEGRAWKEFCRDNLGYFLQDTDDAERIGDSIRTTEATVRDSAPGNATPAVPITGLRRPGAVTFSPPPPPLEAQPQPIPQSGGDATPVAAAAPQETIIDVPQETAPRARADEPEVPPAKTVGSTEAAPAAPSFDEEESKRLDAEEAAKQKQEPPSLPWR